jgi:hypothetical protein
MGARLLDGFTKIADGLRLAPTDFVPLARPKDREA